jgi:hypothetical protein
LRRAQQAEWGVASLKGKYSVNVTEYNPTEI